MTTRIELSPEALAWGREQAESAPPPDPRITRRLVQLLGTAPVGVKR